MEFLNHGFLARFIAPSTTFRLHLTPVRMAKIKKTKDNKCCWGCGVKGSPYALFAECKLTQQPWASVWQFLRKLEIVFSIYISPLWPSYATPWHTLRDSFSYQSDTRSSLFIASLVSIAKTWKQCINWGTSWKQGSVLFSYKEKWIWQGNEWSWKMNEVTQKQENKYLMFLTQMHRSVGSLDWCVQPRLPVESGRVKKGYWWGRSQGRGDSRTQGLLKAKGEQGGRVRWEEG